VTAVSRPTASHYAVAGLRSPVEILIDSWGIPHIYADCEPDVYFAQGFNAARERLWQIDLWRRAGLGLLSEVLGPEYVERDRAARLFLYRGSMEAELSAYGCDLEKILEPFIAGINEYVEMLQRRPELMPIEFRSLDYQPALWSAPDILRIRAHGRYRNLRSEVARARVLYEFGPAAEALRVRLEPETELVVADGLDLSVSMEDVLHVYDLATGPAYPAGATMELGAIDGSNNWVVGPRRTATNRPILANDPHRALSLPALRYLAHLCAPGFDVVGGGEPMLPGISFGHNGTVAFGLTVIPVDYEDLYVYETDERLGERYSYGSGYEEMSVVREQIPVRGHDPTEVVLKFTRHGPIVHESSTRKAAAAVRAAWLEPGMAPYVGSLALLRTADWEEFRAAASHWGAPGENLVYADANGNIGWQPVARVPIRPNWTGLLPVPGDGRFEWDGFAEFDSLPHEYNPERGWIASANHFNIDRAATNGVDVAFEWEPPYRYQRIAEVLEGDDENTVERSADLQSDYLCGAAKALRPLMADVRSSDMRVQRAVALLTDWDARLTPDAAAACVFEVWFRCHLRRALFGRALAQSGTTGDLERAIAAAVSEESSVADARIDLELIHALPPDERNGLFQDSLRTAMLDLERRLGPETSSWRWGSLHHATFDHPVRGDTPGCEPLGPVERGGSADTVGNTQYSTGAFREIVGATLRLVIDVGGWDHSLAMNAPGQSGAPDDPHYADLLDPWAADESRPLLFSRDAVERVTTERLWLAPASDRTRSAVAAGNGAKARTSSTKGV
jgi:penicillin amidase